MEVIRTTFGGGRITSSGVNFIFERASICWAPDDYGVLIRHEINQPSINHDGILTEPQTTNYCTNHNSSPQTSLSGVSCTDGSVESFYIKDKLDKAGLENICNGYAFKYKNNTGENQTISISGQTGNTYLASISCYALVEGGDVIMQMSGGAGAIPIPASIEFEYLKSENIAHASATDVFQFVVGPGATVLWILNMLEAFTVESAMATSPIVTNGSQSSRAATKIYSEVLSSFPSNNFVVKLSISPGSRYQKLLNPYYLSIYKDANNSLSINTIGSLAIKKRISGTTYTANVTYGQDAGCSNLAIRCSDTIGVDAWVNAEKGQVTSSNTAAINLSGSRVYLGSLNTFDQHFFGRIKSFSVYDTALPDSDMSSILMRWPAFTRKSLGKCGLPVYEAGTTRIWALSWSESSSYFNGIQYTDDYGDTWTQWTTWSLSYATTFTLTIDAAGNFYAASIGSTYLYRIDRVTKSIAIAVNFNAIPGTPVWSWGWLSWHWAVSPAGVIVTTGYQTTNTGGQYLWVSHDNGLNFNRVDQFVTRFPLCKHFHSIKFRNNGRLYLCLGDNSLTRGVYYTDDLLATDAIQISDADTKGPTGLTFTETSVWVGTDSPGAQNYIKSTNDDISFVKRFSTPKGYQLAPIYYLVAVSDNEMWAVLVDDASSAGSKGGVLKLSKRRGDSSPFEYTIISDSHEPELEGAVYYALSQDNSGTIPASSPFVFVYLSRFNSTPGPYAQTYRIRRSMNEVGGTINAGVALKASVVNGGPPRNNITRLAGTSTTINPTDTYKFSDTNGWRAATGFVYGVDHWAYNADGTPKTILGSVLIANGEGDQFFCGSKRIAGYSSVQVEPALTKIKRLTGV